MVELWSPHLAGYLLTSMQRPPMTPVRLIVLTATLLTPAVPLRPQQLPPPQTEKVAKRGDVLTDAPDMATQLEHLRHALVRLPIAAGFACMLAMRPRRRGTPTRQQPVIQTQIILAVVGAVVMLVVGSS